MTEKIIDLFTCRNCQWGDQCPAPHSEICEYYDSLSEMEADIEEKLFINVEYISFESEWQEYCFEYNEECEVM